MRQLYRMNSIDRRIIRAHVRVTLRSIEVFSREVFSREVFSIEVSSYNTYSGALCGDYIEKISIDRRIIRAHVRVTARSQRDWTRSGRQNGTQNPLWASLVSFQMAHLKRELNFVHRGCRLSFRDHFVSRPLGNGLYITINRDLFYKVIIPSP